MEEVPRHCFVFCLIGLETEGLVDYQGTAEIIAIVRWNLRPVIFGVERRGTIERSQRYSSVWFGYGWWNGLSGSGLRFRRFLWGRVFCVYQHSIPSRPKLLQRKLLKNNCFGTTNFVKNAKQSLYKANSFACSLANRDKPLAATLQRKCFGGIILVIITKNVQK